MKLRRWQHECIELALEKYQSGQNHFLVQATPAAGKTFMTANLANRLLNDGGIDLVLCFSPSSIIASEFSTVLSEITQYSFDGKIGDKGQSITYQKMAYLDESFWSLFEKFKVLAVFDEIHHCSGTNDENANEWGKKIIANIQDKATYTLALSGTPWRSDAAPISLAKYYSAVGKIKCDYAYGLLDAIRDNVCRIPKIVAIDNDEITLSNSNSTRFFNSFGELLLGSSFGYKELIHNENVIIGLLKRADKQLNLIRQSNPSAGGLIVASSVEHAMQITQIIEQELNEIADLVSYKEDNPTEKVQQYKQGTKKWIVSIGMISEGTNIPRLQVCCHLTNIKTELHYRQILGRILRVTHAENQEATLFMPAETKLVEYAYRISDDIPEQTNIVSFETIENSTFEPNAKDNINTYLDDNAEANVDDLLLLINGNFTNSVLTDSYEAMTNTFGRYHQEIIDFEALPA
ncbi:MULTISPECIES: DEAD/DEAH box helicase [unclassified Colwellia]|uniref:DEAD/DEAH box helicase n=1 Tax=unclassified Colwellia TaxID=196834 RepID=UPI0015F66855|nr:MULTISPECIES: DEAD/DEAH box helicase family protein [unclassified Colwellia]MBA6232425.1 DEAD/DEAH box helicase family protein [Colwellia sp. MB02u-7]MBA6238282.1 DEAD/DEAH box helicase family protein [Colwellia sp. MB02u-11]MBA6301032.1 DEAD/DEAH box helicase family protein [Colwellia sp. MB3u-22]MBA6310036.1 DEAD/DEAH box helicase family protein [Colwellia sp. MB3u-64]